MQSEEHLMGDPSALIPWITPIITTVVMYIKTQGVQKTADKVAKVVEEKAAEEMVSKGQKAFVLLHSRFFAKADEKAKRALANVEHYPEDDDYKEKLIKETARLASADPTFAQDLKVLGENVTIAQPGSMVIDNKAPNYGAQGEFHAPVHFNQP
jgi:hypothetical protein